MLEVWLVVDLQMLSGKREKRADERDRCNKFVALQENPYNVKMRLNIEKYLLWKQNHFTRVGSTTVLSQCSTSAAEAAGNSN